MHGAGAWWVLGSGAWHPLDPSWVPLPVLRGRLNILEARVRGLASPDPFLGAFRGILYHFMEAVEVVQLVLLLGDRSWYASATDHAVWRWPHGVLPLVQFLDKVADLPVASLTGTWGRQC